MAEEGFFSRWARRKAQARQDAPLPQEPAAAAQEAARAEPVDAPPRGGAASPSTTSAARTQGLNPEASAAAPPPPTLADVAQLGRDSDYSRFVAPDVAPGVKNAALRKLFADPHFNVMDGLDIYIDDYTKPDPIPPAMLRQLAQSKLLGLFDDEGEEEKKKEQQSQQPPLADDAPTSTPAAAPVDDAPTADAPPGLPAALAAPATPSPTPSAPAHENADLQLQPHDAAGRPGTGQGAAQVPGTADRP